MKKILVLLLISISLILSINPVFATENEIIDENETMVNNLLGNFYNNDNYFEIFYGNQTIDQKTKYYNDTYSMYINNDYAGILQYNVSNDITVIKTINPIVSVLSIATRPINKSASKTYSIDQGGYFQYGTVTVRFTGSYTYHTGDEEITGVSVTSSVSKPSNFSISNSSLSKSYTSTVITMTQKMDVHITTGTGTTNTSYNQKFTATVNAN